MGITMRFPKSLPKGGTIGFVAPSFGCATEPYKSAFMNACKKWREMGYRLDLGPNCFAESGTGISNTPEACAGELMSYYAKKDVDCLISCGGGELMCEILDFLDFEALGRMEPKWFLGYSDNTNLTFLLATLCDTASVYGPCASTFGMEPWHGSLWDAMNLLTGSADHVKGYDLWEAEPLKNPENPLAPYHLTEPRLLKRFPDRDVQFNGRLLGGCMDCLINMVGTGFDKTAEFAERYREDGVLWFLEACELNVFAIRRAMWQMEHAGWFAHAKGFLIGRPANGQEMMGLDTYHAVMDIVGYRDVPVIMDVDLGHTAPMMPLITGSMAEVRVNGNEIWVGMQK